MNPTTVAQVRDAAESVEVVPQKCTFSFPKVPTGCCCTLSIRVG
jgi:uncharacterized protein (DUF1015 family)